MLLSLLLSANLAQAMCAEMGPPRCTKLEIVSAKKVKKRCIVRLKEKESPRIWRASVEDCPHFKGARYVFINYACNDTGGNEPDRLELWPEPQCKAYLEKQKKKK